MSFSILKFAPRLFWGGLLFFNSKGDTVARKQLEIKYGANEFDIHKFISSFPSGHGSFGTFCVFYLPQKKKDEIFQVSNRCYDGYALGKNSIPSFMHGNIHACYKTGPKFKHLYSGIMQVSHRPTNYKLQRDFSEFSRVELMFSNPSNQKIWLEIEKERYHLNVRESILIPLYDLMAPEIRSNLVLPRPAAFCFSSNGHLDCFHV